MMSRTILAATVAAGLTFATVAQAQQTAAPANADDCLKAAFEMAQKAEEKKLSNSELDKVEELLTKMEGHCDAQQFQEAMVIHKDIKTMIEQQR
jgi:hypothetical protein